MTPRSRVQQVITQDNLQEKITIDTKITRRTIQVTCEKLQLELRCPWLLQLDPVDVVEVEDLVLCLHLGGLLSISLVLVTGGQPPSEDSRLSSFSLPPG